MELIDTHCHLAHRRYRRILPDVLERAMQAGVVAVICPAGNVAEAGASLALAQADGRLYCTAGVHPHDAKDAGEGYLAALESLARQAGNVAIGEIGLDYYRDLSPRPLQRRVFAEQLQLAKRLGKPIVVHTREAFADTVAILRESGADAESVAFHSFSEGEAEVRRALAIGATISFSGIVTYARSESLRRAARLVPDDRILVETDGPYLAPEPVRKSKTNEPAYVAHVAARLAAVRNATPQQIAERTTANARRFFRLDAP